MPLPANIIPRFLCVLRMLVAATALWFSTPVVSAAEAVFLRAINLNGPALTIDGRRWEAVGRLEIKGEAFS